jgi:trimethylguanosine synthase
MSSSSENPFGPGLQKYWDRRYEYFSLWDRGIQTDAEGLYSVIPEVVGDAQAKHIQGTHVIDGFAGIGGSAIAFARAGKRVTAIEKDRSRIAMAKHNAQIYGVGDAITFIQGDFFNVAARIEADTINLDPPWGGPEYKELGKFLLEHFSPDGNELLRFSLGRVNEIVLRVPTIFDTSELDRLKVSYNIFDDVSNGDIVSRSAFISH